MKEKSIKISLVLVLLASLTLSGMAWAASVEPVVFTNWTSGDAMSECRQTGYYFEYAYKWNEEGEIDPFELEGAPNGTAVFSGQTITVSNSNGSTFDWQVDPFPLGAVIVKAGTGAYVFLYEDAFNDQGLYAYSGKDISHITFCWNDFEELCYQEETAWATGPRYTQRGNWATYTPYVPDSTVTIYAGQTMDAGTAHFSAAVDGWVEITITLDNGFIFYYDLNDDLEDHNIKIQDYELPPSGNPAIGLFAWKEMAEVGSTQYTITVPENNYYGIHLDVAYSLPCQAVTSWLLSSSNTIYKTLFLSVLFK
jgi:hypothetical protein